MKELLSIEELMQKLKITRLDIYKQISERNMPYEKVNGRMMFDEDEIYKWIEDEIS